MPNWKCDNCGKVHGGNPSKCRSCGHTVLSQTDESPDSALSKLRAWLSDLF